MQTFLPYPYFDDSARVLDNKRLGKQRVECKQILSTLFGWSTGWKNHPAVLMWRGSEYVLVQYTYTVCAEWRRRKFNDSIKEWLDGLPVGVLRGKTACPSWLGDLKFHVAHQSNLIRKDPEFYGCKFPGVPADLPYIWPVAKEKR